MVMVEERVYVGGGIAEKKKMLKMHVYYTTEDRWRYFSRTPVALYGMGHFQDRIITVGGTSTNGLIVGKVYSFEENTRIWEECIKKMPTARASLSVLSTSDNIVTCGGTIWCAEKEPIPCSTVEVYCAKSGTWYKADPLPHPCATMSSTRIGDMFYLLGEVHTEKHVTINNTICADIPELISKATSQTLRLPDRDSTWKTLPAYPLVGSGATSLSGALITVGGHDSDTQPHLYIYRPRSDCWKKLEASDMPVARGGLTAIEILSHTLLVLGGEDFEGDITDTVYVGMIGF